MIRSSNNAGGAGHGSPDDSDSSNNDFPSHRRGRVRGNDWGLPDKAAQNDLVRTYLTNQARLWPELAGTTAVPEPTDAVVG